VVVINFKRFDKSLPAPHNIEGNAGYDLFANLEEGAVVTIQPRQTVKIPLNFATQIPLGYVGLLFQRSSTFKKWGVRLTNNVGVIDSSFQGDGDEWVAEFQNMTDEIKTIKRGDKICQALFFELAPVKLVEVDSFNTADRKGFGTSFDNATDLNS